MFLSFKLHPFHRFSAGVLLYWLASSDFQRCLKSIEKFTSVCFSFESMSEYALDLHQTNSNESSWGIYLFACFLVEIYLNGTRLGSGLSYFQETRDDPSVESRSALLVDWVQHLPRAAAGVQMQISFSSPVHWVFCWRGAPKKWPYHLKI